jgi:hypothetical protein
VSHGCTGGRFLDAPDPKQTATNDADLHQAPTADAFTSRDPKEECLTPSSAKPCKRLVPSTSNKKKAAAAQFTMVFSRTSHLGRRGC